MIGSSDNSVVVLGLLCVEQNEAGSNLALCFVIFFFNLSKFKFLGAIPARSQYNMLHSSIIITIHVWPKLTLLTKGIHIVDLHVHVLQM